MKQTYLYYPFGPFHPPFHRITLVRPVDNTGVKWTVLLEKEQEEANVETKLIVPSPLSVHILDDREQEETYLYYHVKKFMPPFTRVKIISYNVQNDLYTVIDVNTREQIQGISNDLLMPKPVPLPQPQRGGNSPMKQSGSPPAPTPAGRGQVQSGNEESDIEPPPEFLIPNTDNDIELYTRQWIDAGNYFLVKLKNDKRLLGYGQVQSARATTFTIEFLDQTNIIKQDLLDTEFIEADDLKTYDDISFEDFQTKLPTHVEQIMKFFALLKQKVDESTAYQYMFEHILESEDGMLILDQRREIQAVVKQVYEQNIWLNVTLDKSRDTLNLTDLYRSYIRKLKRIKNPRPPFKMFSMLDVYFYMYKLQVQVDGNKSTAKKLLKFEDLISYTVELYNSVFGENGYAYQDDMNNQYDGNGDPILDDEDGVPEEAYTVKQLLYWKEHRQASLLKRYPRLRGSEIAIDEPFDYLIIQYKKLNEYVEGDVEFNIDKQDGSKKSDLKKITNYTKVLTVMDQMQEYVELEYAYDRNGIEERFNRLIESVKH